MRLGCTVKIVIWKFPFIDIQREESDFYQKKIHAIDYFGYIIYLSNWLWNQKQNGLL